VGATWGDCFPDGTVPERVQQEIVARYDYRDESGTVLYQTIRLEPGRSGRDKEFRQRRPKDGGGWEWTLGDVRLVPYRLPELLKADLQDTVHIVAGEKDVETLRSIGLVATTNVGGETRPWLPEYSAFLTGRYVAVVEDADSAGRRHTDEVCGSLIDHGVASLRRVRLPGKDATDYLRALKVGGTVHPAALREAWWAAVSDSPAWGVVS
jgi:putative DNA primase/helicase